ncbi:MAG: MmcQ/YjbR family DNA-binding protein [Candidatus Pelagadaptatus aseana]|uniref:MmcQ/YjbR family DNA-binding protein n=1 Tax=Candidatus Pelagadaptatus aseana TaxID=3120508 RepID=UPI0039B1C546
MNFEQAHRYFLSKPEATEDFPFYPDVPVFKIRGKMFGLLSYGSKGKANAEIARMNLKCDPEQALTLRFFFDAVKPGYHMNKKHWNTVMLDGSVPEYDLRQMIDHSYALVVKGLKKSERRSLELAYGTEALYGSTAPMENTPTTGK